MDSLITSFKRGLLLYGAKSPDQLARLPMDVLSETLNSPYLVVEGGEYERYLLVEKVISEMKEESSSKRAKITVEGSSTSRKLPRFFL
eukprot:CAMPEP_0184362972 /NCGR_PEP_ID=MMETSP1089-20130417/137379_1 /TAXON_ID=38269 ORGANISM="Gloeochaete wittrockiana, Strain SAG46.84" /NCGR_SAMPLE_ID=MMETSP1089 /ASSEMBLY_ACC=CAM_ASM_000445 /LENGTH=87 /DNA_ID=CAMNT_0026703275 /DNA_START=1 /DNA_END=261 /DNA_ORIENTATION=-